MHTQNTTMHTQKILAPVIGAMSVIAAATIPTLDAAAANETPSPVKPLALTQATANDNGGYAKSFNITFPGYTGSETLTNFPVLVRLSAARNDFQYAKCKVPDGGDVRFFDEDGTVLPSEVDTWNPDGESLVWVRVPELTADTVIECRYGNRNPDPVTPSDVWSNGYLGVWHLNEDDVPMADSSGQSAAFTQIVSSGIKREGTAFATNGVVGKAAAFGLSTQYDNSRQEYYGGVNASDSGTVLGGGSAMTVEAWANQRELANDRYLFRKKNAYQLRFSFSASSGTAAAQITAYTDDNTSYNTPGLSYGDSITNVWCHWAMVYDNVENGKVYLLLNGVRRQSKDLDLAEGVAISDNSESFGIGNSAYNNHQAFNGSVDEVRISNVARSDDWMKATYATVNDDDFTACFVPNDWDSYAYRFTVAFPGYAGETLTDFPVLVKISEEDIEGFSYDDCAEGGGDLRFADAEGHLLASEVDTWDPDGVSTVWVKVPTLEAATPGKATTITAYYGWALAPAIDKTAVWSNGYLGVWHLGDGDIPLRDSSVNGLDFIAATTLSSLAKNSTKYFHQYDTCNTYGAPGGAVGRAVAFDASVDSKKGGVVGLDKNAVISGLDAVTFEIWAKCDSFPTSSQYLFTKRFSKDPKYRPFSAYYDTTQKLVARISLDNSDPDNDVAYDDKVAANPSSMTLDSTLAGQWNYHAFEYDSTCTYHTNYLNGAYNNRVGISNNNGYPMAPSIQEDTILAGGNGYGFCLGNDMQASSTSVFDGALDEFRISNVARSADWVNATYRTIADHENFTKYGKVKDNNPNLGMVIIFR